LELLPEHFKMGIRTVGTVVPDTSKVARHGYLFGHPIAHSMSPLLHQTVYDALGLNWSQFPLDSLDMDLFLKLRQDPKFYGTQFPKS
jgi:quinate dehydrogenase